MPASSPFASLPRALIVSLYNLQAARDGAALPICRREKAFERAWSQMENHTLPELMQLPRARVSAQHQLGFDDVARASEGIKLRDMTLKDTLPLLGGLVHTLRRAERKGNPITALMEPLLDKAVLRAENAALREPGFAPQTIASAAGVSRRELLEMALQLGSAIPARKSSSITPDTRASVARMTERLRDLAYQMPDRAAEEESALQWLQKLFRGGSARRRESVGEPEILVYRLEFAAAQSPGAAQLPVVQHHLEQSGANIIDASQHFILVSPKPGSPLAEALSTFEKQPLGLKGR